jgi:hypothetical protein
MAAEKILHFPWQRLPRLPPLKQLSRLVAAALRASTAW